LKKRGKSSWVTIKKKTGAKTEREIEKQREREWG
jgi:hypothetical protein